jgi:phage terminase large subunit-like protein
VHHVGYFPELEDEMCSYVAGAKSPNRLDAHVYSLSELMQDDSSGGFSYSYR